MGIGVYKPPQHANSRKFDTTTTAYLVHVVSSSFTFRVKSIHRVNKHQLAAPVRSQHKPSQQDSRCFMPRCLGIEPPVHPLAPLHAGMARHQRTDNAGMSTTACAGQCCL